ncbi:MULTISPECIES: aldo/keto reductase [unclassified Meiothermus]|uniref:aldo/keto reductase n=1 Tax=unclassified Meiothermus TaxID=370471 RepID=UPI000D7D1B3F|nr:MULTISPECIES: aldo/keto reductase [unclassified Meiothermus]PZA06076.1 aldo/keto reductase [Meiothermus sp. Pnk-1]RYM31396.1 aldo/keto reductase [Meiothermus sp. PNK-Is4]
MSKPGDEVALRGGLRLTRLGLGVGTLGSLFQPVSDEAAQAVLEAAWEGGIRYYDAAPWYGFGLAEERLGHFLAGRIGYVVSTKVGRLLRAGAPPHPSQFDARGEPVFKTPSRLNVVYDYTYDGFMRSLEESLGRLGLDRVDILLIHDPDVAGLSVREVMEGGYKALFELREQGVVRAIGAGMNQWEMLLEFAREGDFDLFLLAGRYTLLEQESLREFLPLCVKKGIGVVIGGVYNSGLLANPRPGAHYNYAEVPTHVLQRALRIQAVCHRHGVPLKAAAIQFPLGHPAVVSVLTAGRTPEQLEENLSMFQIPIPQDLWAELKAEGLLAEAAPVPT